MTKNELQIVLDNHKLWLSDEKTGSRANLQGANLFRADLYRADLRGANLQGANLRDANLLDANLFRANLQDANLQGANLRDADLQDANLLDANLFRADLRCANGIYSFGPVGSERRIGYAVKHKTCIMFQLGCHWGNLDETVMAIEKKYGIDSQYEKQVRLAAEILEEI